MSDSSVRMGSRFADDKYSNVVVTEGATVEEVEAPSSSASEHVPSEDGPEDEATVVLPSVN